MMHVAYPLDVERIVEKRSEDECCRPSRQGYTHKPPNVLNANSVRERDFHPGYHVEGQSGGRGAEDHVDEGYDGRGEVLSAG